ncbi:MAG: FAD-dependent monooxygenase [Bradymonadaceae bacterium]
MVIGAGPTGMTAALGLARRGLSVRMVDKGGGSSTRSKAFVVHPRTLESVHPLGVAEPLAEAAHQADGAKMYADGQTLAQIDVRDVESPFPGLHVMPQSTTERVLLEAVEAEPAIELEWETEVADVTGDETGVDVKFADGRTDRTPWLLGCDGAHSTVRKSVDADFEGEAIPGWFGLADVELTGEIPDRRLCVFLHPDGLIGCISYGDEGRYRVIATLPDQPVDREPEIDETFLRGALETRTHLDAEIESVGWTSAFSIQQRRARAYRYGRIFLAGDAAHVHSPAGAQGMNTGMQDAVNLTWKIGRVAADRSSETLLDSYEAERIPVAEDLLRGTGISTKIAASDNPLVKAVRNRLVHFMSSVDAIHRRLVRNLTMIEIAYPNSPIVDEQSDSIWTADIVGDEMSEAASVAERWAFRQGPNAGGRVPPGPVSGLEGASSIYDFISHEHFTLLLFDGRVHTDEGDRRLDEIRRALEDRDDVASVIVVSRDERPDVYPDECDVCLDNDFGLHEQFSADAECLYLLRPDGYIAYRQQPPSLEGLEKFLGAI